MTTTSSPLVWIASENPEDRETCRRTLPAAEIAAVTLDNTDEILAAHDAGRTACVVAELSASRPLGAAWQQLLATRRMAMPLIVVLDQNPANVGMAVQALKQGAFDVLVRPVDDAVLRERVHKALASDAHARQQRTAQEVLARRLASLTPQERRVLDLVVAGDANKQIARTLELSPRTVEAYRARVMTKMAATSIAALVRMVLLAEPLENPPTLT